MLNSFASQYNEILSHFTPKRHHCISHHEWTKVAKEDEPLAFIQMSDTFHTQQKRVYLVNNIDFESGF